MPPQRGVAASQRDLGGLGCTQCHGWSPSRPPRSRGSVEHKLPCGGAVWQRGAHAPRATSRDLVSTGRPSWCDTAPPRSPRGPRTGCCGSGSPRPSPGAMTSSTCCTPRATSSGVPRKSVRQGNRVLSLGIPAPRGRDAAKRHESKAQGAALGRTLGPSGQRARNRPCPPDGNCPTARDVLSLGMTRHRASLRSRMAARGPLEMTHAETHRN